ncbi:hypothetical protein BU16DRAFT_622931 [Lophium mytilinum]|uniref:Uncharacterized protein n=1 Tax=Lophium mytilinum TaxID=390894 RepID=A0A6A6QBM7_9PEZI|nr:hypothetical protein BU16DRAFT_622931 [Lophium mytilinum]
MEDVPTEEELILMRELAELYEAREANAEGFRENKDQFSKGHGTFAAIQQRYDNETRRRLTLDDDIESEIFEKSKRLRAIKVSKDRSYLRPFNNKSSPFKFKSEPVDRVQAHSTVSDGVQASVSEHPTESLAQSTSPDTCRRGLHSSMQATPEAECFGNTPILRSTSARSGLVNPNSLGTLNYYNSAPILRG